MRRGHEVVHFSASWTPRSSIDDELHTIRLRRLFKSDYQHERDFGRRLLPHLARERFDAVHSLGRHDALASIRAARLRRDGRRTVITDLGFADRGWWRTQGRREARAVQKVVSAIDVYSLMSQTAVDSLAKNYGRHDGVVVPGGVDTKSFVPAPAREPRPTILFSGVISEPRKGVPTLLAALPLIARAEPGVVLQLSGPGDPEPFLAAAPPAARNYVMRLGVGDPDRQHERYGRAWITCLPSRRDSFGMALVESLACGTPIVVTTDGAPKELVDEGVTGELCVPEDPASLAAACLRGFALARKAETVASCRRTAEPFDWDLGIAPLCERLYCG